MKTQEPTALPLGIHDIGNHGQEPVLGLEPNAVSVRQINSFLGLANESAQQVLAPRLDCGGTKRASNGKLGHSMLSDNRQEWRAGQDSNLRRPTSKADTVATTLQRHM
jgi:hypothetical protein